MFNPKKRVVWTVIVLAAVVACVAGGYVAQQWSTQQGIDPHLFHGTLLDSPRQVQPFHLTGIDNQPFNNASLRGQWTMIFFGFTRCGYMCPTTMAELGKTYRLLEKQGSPVLPRVVMITLDPARDSVERLSKYVTAFDSHFYGARGGETAIRVMTRDLGIAYATVVRNDTQGSQQDDIEHTGAVMLFNPQGHLVAFFTTPHRADHIASDVLLLINRG